MQFLNDKTGRRFVLLVDIVEYLLVWWLHAMALATDRNPIVRLLPAIPPVCNETRSRSCAIFIFVLATKA